jgi:hypothetical protein
VSCFTKKEEKERIKREGDREACNLSKLIQLLREKLSMSEEHPKALLSLTQLRKPAQGLNQYLGHNAEYNEYHNTRLGNNRLPGGESIPVSRG